MAFTEKIKKHIFIDYMNLMNGYQADYNCHHRGNIQEHSIWTARQTDRWINGYFEKDEDWIKNLVNLISPKYKTFTIILALLHDIGKIDGDKKTFIKPNHPKYGYNVALSSNFSIFQEKSILSTVGLTSKQLSAFLAVVSYMHQYLGDIMQKKMTPDQYIDEYLNIIPRGVGITYSMFLQLLYIILVISLADVRGAWKVGDDIIPMNTNFEILYTVKTSNHCDINPRCDFCKHYGYPPWKKYKYQDKKAVMKIMNEINEEYFSQFSTSRGDITTIKNSIPLPDKNSLNLEWEVSVIDGRTTLYKAINNPAGFKKGFSTWKEPTWLARNRSTATTYVQSWKYTNVALIKTKPGEKLNLLRMDSKKNFKNIHKLLYQSYLVTGNNKYYLDLYNQLEETFKMGSINDTTYNLDIIRKSIHEIDIKLTKEIICKLGLDGYIAPRLLSFTGDFFHEEVALCFAGDKTEIVSIEKANTFKPYGN